MHELALAKGIIDIVGAEAQKHDFDRVLEISLRVGEFSGILPECLRGFFPIAAAGSRAEGARLCIETVPGRFRCGDCGYEGAIDRKAACCPDCGSTAIRMVAGREFYVENLKVE